MSRSRAIAMLVAVATLGLGITDSSSGKDGDSDRGKGFERGFPSKEQREADRKRLRALRAERNSDEARAKRRRSRTAYSGASRGEAVRIARSKFGGVIKAPAWNGAAVGRGARVERYLSDYSARLDLGPGPQAAILESTAPLRTLSPDGRKVPIDLRLRVAGDRFEPRAEHVALTIDRDARKGVSFDRADLGVRVAGADAIGQIVKDKAFFANALQDTDVVVMPLPGGAETLLHLRSAASPEATTLSFELPKGAELRPDGRGVTVAQGSREIAHLDPPLAADADGTRVPVSYHVAGDDLVVRTAHRDRDVRYPIMVDPNIVFAVSEIYGGGWPGAWSDYVGWESVQSGPHWWNYAFVPGSGGGLDMSGSNSAYNYNEWRQWRYQAPPNSYIYRAELQSSHQWYWDCIEQGIWAAQSFNWQSMQQPNGCGGSYWHHWTTTCTESQCSPGATWNYDGNYAIHALRNAYGDAVVHTPNSTWVRLEAAKLYERDRNLPRYSAFSGNHPSSGWVKSGNYHVDVTAVDDGLGAYMVEMANNTGNGYSIEKRHHGCTGDRHSRCPATWGPPSGTSWSTRFNYSAGSLPEGVNWLSLTAWDAVGNRAAEDKIWALAFDHTAPAIEDPSGDLWNRRNQSEDRRFQGLYEATYTMDVTAVGEGSNPNDWERRSGVKSIDIEVVDARTGAVEKSSPDPTPQECPQSSCTKTRPFTFVTDEYSDGEKIIRITATDHAQNTSDAKEFRVTVDRRGDIYRATSSTGPAPSGEILNDEWVKYGTKVARHEEAHFTKTRGPVDCGGSTCHEVRTRTVAGLENPAASDGYTVYRGNGTDDPRLEQIAELLEAADEDPNKTAPRQGSGPLENALSTWQAAPPAHGPEYSMYESTEPVDDDPANTVTTRYWIDARTQMPLKLEIIDPADGTTLATTYWDYDVERKLESELPANFFHVGAPSNISYEKNVTFHGNGPIGPRVDAETGTPFQPYDLGGEASFGTTRLCLATATSITDHDREPSSIPRPEPTDPPDETDPSPRDLSRFTTVESYYDALGGGETCSAGLRVLDEPAIEVVSMARGSSEAAEFRESYALDGAVTPLEPDPIGVVPLPTAPGGPLVAFTMRDPSEEPGTTAFIDLADTSVVITGAYDRSELNQIVAQLRPR